MFPRAVSPSRPIDNDAYERWMAYKIKEFIQEKKETFWIDTKERLPDDGRDVFILFWNRDKSIGCFSGGEWFAGRLYTKREITHWAEIPALPPEKLQEGA